MTPEEKLKIFREKISNATTFDNNFRQLLGIELFDFIHENKILKNEFYKRFNYLEDLATDKSFRLLQDNLFKTIQEILKLISLKEVNKWQKELNIELINNLKTRHRKNLLTLPELYLELQNKDAYYRLEDDSDFNSILSVKRQYEETVENY